MKMSRASVYRLMVKANFPLPIRITAKICRWKRAEIENWVNKKTS